MTTDAPHDELEHLREQVEALEARLDAQSSQLRLFWGLLLGGIVTIVLLSLSLPVTVLVVLLGPLIVVVVALLIAVLKRMR
ncbi:hypothetical protein ACLI4Y_09200 [Natrialbaceae archaeon A-CW3]